MKNTMTVVAILAAFLFLSSSVWAERYGPDVPSCLRVLERVEKALTSLEVGLRGDVSPSEIKNLAIEAQDVSALISTSSGYFPFWMNKEYKELLKITRKIHFTLTTSQDVAEARDLVGKAKPIIFSVIDDTMNQS